MKNLSNATHGAWKALMLAVLLISGQISSAQTDVRIYGVGDISVGWGRNPGGDDSTTVDSGRMTTSFIGLSGSEDLGSGLSAVFRFESFLRIDSGDAGRFNGDAFFGRTASVGVNSAAAGRLTLGRHTTPLFVNTARFNAFADSGGYSPSVRHFFIGVDGTTIGDTAWNDSLLYTSPVFGGFKVGFIAALGETNTATGGENYGLNIGYGAGSIALGGAFQRVRKDGIAASQDTDTSQLGVSWANAKFKLFGQIGKVANKTTDNDYDIFGVGARVNLGTGVLLFQAGMIEPAAGASRQTISAGYDYFLSKRTDLYLAAMTDDIDNGSTTGRSFSVGIRHRF